MTRSSGKVEARRAIGLRVRFAVIALSVVAAFGGVGAQLVRLALAGHSTALDKVPRLAVAEAITRSVARPDIVDVHGRVIAADLPVPSLYADPHAILDIDEVVDQFARRFSDIDAVDLRAQLADRSRRFVWLRRAVSPRIAQSILDLGLPGVAVRTELKRVYPQGRLASHLVGAVGSENQGLAGVERLIDDLKADGRLLQGPDANPAPVRLTLDIGVQHGLEAELGDAMVRHEAKAAAGVLLDVTTGDIVAAASLPAPDPTRPLEAQDPAKIDRLSVGTYELGSIFKTATVALALDRGRATLDSVYDVRVPLKIGAYTIRDLHPSDRPLSVRDIFIQSSNVGAGMVALDLGDGGLKSFIQTMGLLEPLRWELGRVAHPQQPRRWGRLETVTIAYGHGLAVAPLQFAVSASALVNGGTRIEPGILADRARHVGGARVVSAETSRAIAGLMRRNVTHPKGTGRRAEIEGLDIGGKTGTAEMPGKGGYQQKAVISSFLAAFPTERPRYVLLVLVFEPKASAETLGQITAGVIAAPLAGRIIQRAAPLLDLP